LTRVGGGTDEHCYFSPRIAATAMAIFEVTSSTFQKVPETTFAQERLLERRDLQRLLRANISVLSPDLLVVAEEFGEWEDSSRRIDLLCLDKSANLVVVELKRTEDGGHMELQALRYAAMVSSMTFERLCGVYARFLGKEGESAHADAKAGLLAFLGRDASDAGSLSGEVRIILVSADFSVELTTAVLWLNKHDLDVTCMRIKPYRLDGRVLVDVQQLIPLPESADYETRLKEQHQEEQRAETSRKQMFRRFWKGLIERSQSRTAVFRDRAASDQHWQPGRAGKSGFSFNLVVLQEDHRVECYIDLGKDSDERNLAALQQLKARCEEVERRFGAELEWQELEDSRACRICCSAPGGWKTPEVEWPRLQDAMIEEMVRFESALKPAILALPE
jgi:hypothetical protein